MSYLFISEPQQTEIESHISAEEVLAGLNPVQQEAVAEIEGPVLLVAGPGSGKTRTLTHRIAYILAKGRARPYDILALTFTNKAAREMRERIQHLLGEEQAGGLWMGTFHSIFSRILRREADKLGYTSDFSIYDTDDSERVVRNIMTNSGIDTKRWSPRSVRHRISAAKNQLLSPNELAQDATEEFEHITAKVFTRYSAVLEQANAFDFDDLLVKPIQLFQEHEDTLAYYQRRWKYIHIDEYQDTNRAQYMIAQMLAGQHRNLCVVGDDAQSIYAFRGADIRNILSFQKDYPEAKVIRLEQNYRSTQRILRLADAIIGHNQGQIKKNLWTENVEGEPVILMEALSERDEAQKIERRIRDMAVRHGVALQDMAVLYRTNAQSRSLEDALRRGNIPYRIYGGLSFYGRREIKDALAYLRLVVNPASEADLRRIINLPVRGIGDKTMFHIAEYTAAHNLTLWEGLLNVHHTGLAGRAVNAVQSFTKLLLPFIQQSATLPADELARNLLHESGLLTQLREENTIESLQRWENVQELISALAEFTQQQGSPENSLSEFLQQITLITDADQDESDPNRVTLMTLHASKGLEYRVVFVTGLEEGLFPLTGATMSTEDIEEERRLFYVGATRAKEVLFLSYAHNRYRFGVQTPALRSRFLNEISVENVVYSEAGRPFTGKKRRSIGYDGHESIGNDPHAYCRNLRPPPVAAPVPSGHHVVYDEGEMAIRPGIRVLHEQFGEGKVLAMEGEGDRASAVVHFGSVGQKKLRLKFAKLQVMG